MARQKKPPTPPSNAYLLSFGDTMTTLLAFFIVLNSLAEDQTGANLYKGTGSFVRAINSLGLSGHITGDRGQLAVEHQHTHPDYVVPGETDDFEPQGLGPDENANNIRVIDRDADDFERFVNELQRVADVDNLPSVQAESVFDFFTPLNRKAPMLSQAYHEAIAEVLPLLHRSGCAVEVVVWATTPKPTARARATKQAAALAEEIANLARLTPERRNSLTSTGRPWFDEDAERPQLSLYVRRVSTP